MEVSLACCHVRQKRLAVPRVKVSVVARLTARVGDQVVGDPGAAAESIIFVDGSPRHVVEQVAVHFGKARLYVVYVEYTFVHTNKTNMHMHMCVCVCVCACMLTSHRGCAQSSA